MQARYNGTLTRYGGRLELDEITLHENATVVNYGVIHTWTTISNGKIEGRGEWWARYDTSRPIGGDIASTQIIIYWPFDRRFALPVVYGGLVCIPKLKGDGGIT